ncbi:MAG: hypothetical protein QOG80_2192 [Pseudonocardiales bacterium]|nr:hypothetical protein [Pseudonocardiales bacterium]
MRDFGDWVMTMRRKLGALAVFGLLSAGVLLAGSAVAAPTPTSVPGTCVPYPVKICQAQIASSTTAPQAGATIEVSGTGYQANEDVAITIGGISVGTAHTDGAGNFDPAVVVPASLTGDQPLTGTGASGQPYDVDSLVLVISAFGVEPTNTGTGTGTGGGGLASTGVQVAAFTGLGVALIAGGAIAVAVGRRRRSATHSS